MKKRVIAAWVCSVISLLFFVIAAPVVLEYSLGPYDAFVMFLASAGAGFGISTWRPTEKSKVGLIGGIVGAMVVLGYGTCAIIWIVGVL